MNAGQDDCRTKEDFLEGSKLFLGFGLSVIFGHSLRRVLERAVEFEAAGAGADFLTEGSCGGLGGW